MPRKKQDLSLETATSKLPFKSEARCHICQSSSRSKVDKLLAAQFSYMSIARELLESDDDFKDKPLDTVRKNVERHAKAHVDIRNKAIRRIVENRAREQGVLLDEVEGKITSGRALLDILISNATEQAVKGQPVRFADAIEAVKLLEDVQKAEFQSQLEVLQRQVYAISQAVKIKVPAAMLPGIVEEARRIFEGDTLQLEKAS